MKNWATKPKNRMTFLKELKYRVVCRAASILVRLWFGSCRIEFLNSELLKALQDRTQSGVLAGWHRGAILAIYLAGITVQAAIMISRSEDGEYLARVAKNLGLTPVRGSSSRGGRLALDEMVDHLRSGRVNVAGTVADGPRGPRKIAKKGMVVLSMKTGVPLIPFVWSCNRGWTFEKSWDKTVLPKPFSHVLVDFGEPIYYAADLEPAQIKEETRKLSELLNQMTQKLDLMTGYEEPD